MRTQQFDSSLAFLGLHTGYMGMGHGHAPGPALLIIRAVGVYAYDAGGVPLRSTTCVGAACTSSIELTCSRTCGRMACTCAYNTATTYSLFTHMHMHMRSQYGTPYYMHMRMQYDSSYYGSPQFASQLPGSIIIWTLRIIPRGWCVACMRKGKNIPASARPARPRSS